MFFETKRLILRPWLETDAESLYEYAKDPQVGPIAGWPVHTSVKNSLEIIRSVLAVPETFAVCLKTDNRAIGNIGLMFGRQSNIANLTNNEAEVGYWIGVPFWGYGLIPEAVRCLQQYAFETLSMEKLWCGYFDGNTKSKRVQEKCGFRYQYTLKDIEWKLMNDIRTEHITCLTKEEWKNINQTNLLQRSDRNFQRAKEIIDELQIVEAWQKFGAKANLVGSARMRLMMRYLDIDFHIYSEPFSVADSFAAITAFATNNRIKDVSYKNLIDTDEKCLEWHLWYHDMDDRVWQLDMIHILNDSPYAGYFERMADRISAVLTPEQKIAILTIKNEVPDSERVMGVEVYQAVIRDGVRTYAEFTEWHKTHQPNGIVEWMP